VELRTADKICRTASCSNGSLVGLARRQVVVSVEAVLAGWNEAGDLRTARIHRETGGISASTAILSSQVLCGAPIYVEFRSRRPVSKGLRAESLNIKIR